MEEDDREPPRIRLSNAQVRYVQVADDLEKRIKAGEWPFDATLPRREEIAYEYGVGEMTVRRATGLLVSRGLLVARSSVGHVVIWTGHEQGTPLPPQATGNHL